MLTPRRPATIFGPYPLAGVAAVFALAVGIPGMTGTPGPQAGTGARAGAVWAMTVSGQKVLVTKPKFIPTPIHPEKITHPGADYMGAVNNAHAPGLRSAKINSTVLQLPGIDISSYQGNINWPSVAPYIDFTYAKATEATNYKNPYFYNQYEGPYYQGLIRGAYHFAIPDNSSGKAQADYFIKHGGGWSGDGHTLPGALDIEFNPYGPECYYLTASQMVSWLKDFVHEYAYKEKVYPVIYTNTNWWRDCTGNYGGLGKYDPLWIANYSDSHGGTLPHGWSFYTFWQYSSSGSLPGDQDVFNGDHNRLRTLATKG